MTITVRDREAARELLAILAAEVECLEGIGTAALMGHCRLKPVAEARHAIALVAHNMGHSLPHIGAALAKDHTTILNSVRKARALCLVDPGFATLVRCLSARAPLELAA